MRHPNAKDAAAAPYVIVAGEHGIDRPGSIDCDERTLDALGMPMETAVTSSLVMIPGEPVHLSLTHPDDLRDDLDAALADAGSRPVVKVGPVHDEGHLEVLRDALAGCGTRLIFDGEAFSSSADIPIAPEAAAYIKGSLLPLAALFCPDVDESEQILGRPINTEEDLRRAAGDLLAFGPQAVLLKGGQLGGGTVVRDYYTDGAESFWLATPKLSPLRIAEHKGLNANLAAAIAGGLAHGLDMRDALVMARGFMQQVYRLGADEPPPFPCAAADFPWVERQPQPAREPFPPIGGPRPEFYPIVDSFEWVKRLADAGVNTVQLRVKELAGAALEEEIKNTAALCRSRDVRLFVNDHWALAIRHGAYGVHLGQEDLQTADVDAIRAAGLRLGVSTHCYFEAAVAHGLRPSYIALGPIYPTTIKSMAFAPQGLDTLRLWKGLFECPVAAIGGITLERADEVLAAGADLVSVITDVAQHGNPDARARGWLEKMAAHR